METGRLIGIVLATGFLAALACSRGESFGVEQPTPHEPQDYLGIDPQPLTPILRDGPNEWFQRDDPDPDDPLDSADPKIEGNFAAALTKFRRHPQIRSASWGLCVLDRRTGRIKVNVNCDTSLTPASILKVVTTGSALLSLGPDFRYHTQLAATGELTPKGVLQGDLIIIGGGDPTLGSERVQGSLSAQQIMTRWADTIKSHGIMAVQGDIIAETRIFDEHLVPSTWNYDDVGYHYGAPVDGLNFKDNYAHLVFQSSPDVADSPLLQTIIPSDLKLDIVSRLTVNDPAMGIYAFGGPLTNERALHGSLPATDKTYTVNISIPDPALYAAQRLLATLKGEGIPVKGRARTLRFHTDAPPRQPQTQRILDWYESPPLDKIVEITNLSSMNMYTEVLVKTMGVHLEGQGSLYAGLNAIREIWRERDISWHGVTMSDGSGLSRANMITPRHMVSITADLLASDVRQAMWDSLPVAGRTGSLRRSLRKTPAENNLRAKSGYLTRVRSYTGYVRSGEGDLIFSISVNDYDGLDFRVKREIHDLMASLAAWGRPDDESKPDA